MSISKKIKKNDIVLLKNIMLALIMVIFPSIAIAQGNKAETLLDKAVDVIKADAGVQMNFSIVSNDIYDSEQYNDKGILKIDGDKYALLTDRMKLWCDGETQWSYIAQNNEIYISEPNADDARTFSPVHIMELYKEGYRSSFDEELSTSKVDAVTMKSVTRGNDMERITVFLDKRTNLPAMLEIYYENGMSARIEINSYKKDCKFSNKEFRCREKDFRGVEIVDMR